MDGAFRWIRDARELRLQRKVQRMRLQSDAAQLQRELHQLQGQLQAERRHQQSLEQELRQVQRARLAHSAGQSGWQLGAVQLYHNRVVQATPVRVSAWTLQQHSECSATARFRCAPCLLCARSTCIRAGQAQSTSNSTVA